MSCSWFDIDRVQYRADSDSKIEWLDLAIIPIGLMTGGVTQCTEKPVDMETRLQMKYYHVNKKKSCSKFNFQIILLVFVQMSFEHGCLGQINLTLRR